MLRWRRHGGQAVACTALRTAKSKTTQKDHAQNEYDDDDNRGDSE